VGTKNDPAQIGRYQVIERVGRGGMGVLFRGMDPVLDREVAIKLMLVDFSEDEEQMRPRFYREARAAAKLQHRNIVTVFEFAEEGSTPYIVMEFLRGTSLAARMASPLPLALEAKLDVIAQLCDALNYAHEQGVVHRDVKPANVFLLTDGTVKLLDFGIAKVTTSTLTRQGDVLGSASYMSPEQVAGSDSVDGRADIFSIGVVLYELLAGRKPFHAEAPTAIIMKILHEDPPAIEQFVPGIPAQLIAAVNKALAKKPEDRFQTAGELSKQLQWIRKALLASTEGGAALEETRFATPTEIRRFQEALEQNRPADSQAGASSTSTGAATARPKWVVPAGVAAAVAVLAIGGLMFTRSAPPAAATAGPAPTPVAAGAAATAGAKAPTRSEVAPAAAETAALQIDTEPKGATIILDGRDTKQTTPASIALKGPGPHRLQLTKRGFVARDVKLADEDLRAGSVSFTLAEAKVAVVPVSISSAYPVEVFEGSKSISRPNQTHQINVPAGTTIRVRNSEYLLDAPLKVEGKTDYQAPGLGYLTILTKYETCSVKIGSKDLGFPPISKLPIVAGQYKVDVVCPNGPNPNPQFVTVAPNSPATARIY
jgi:eukaryotic-like serine/threonine-protein kinase